MAQSLDASVSNLMSDGLVAKSFSVAEVCFCLLLHVCTYFFWLEQLSITASFKNYYCLYRTISFSWYCVCWTARSDGDCQLIPPVHKVSFLSIFLVFGLDLLCLYVVWDLLWTVSSRETGNVFQSLKLNQTVSHICGNISNMFVAELALFASVNYSFPHYLEGLLFHSYSK